MVLVLRTTYCSGAGTSFSGRYRSFHPVLRRFPPRVLLLCRFPPLVSPCSAGVVWFVFVSGAGFRVRRRGSLFWCLDQVVLVLFRF
jgi:hypothetical protein